MKRNWRSLCMTIGLFSCLAAAVPACTVRAGVRARVRATPVLIVAEQPPPPRYVTVQPRPNYVWIRGHWQSINGRWVWHDGHWEAARAGYHWEAGHWDQRGNRWHWVEGRWITAPHTKVVVRHQPAPAPPTKVVVRHNPAPAPAPATAPPTRVIRVKYPTQAPPRVRVEKPGVRAGHVWISGRYEWQDRWVWSPGHWEKARAGQAWNPGHWEQRGDRWVWVDGGWVRIKAKTRGGNTIRVPKK